MIVKKCDICGAEMRITTPRYKITFDGWLYTKEKDICIDCFKRISDEIKQAADRKTENSSEIPNNCEDESQYDFGAYADRLWRIAYERGKREALEQTEAQTCDNCKLKDTTEWCKRQEVCRAYQPKDEPQKGEMMTDKEIDKMIARVVNGRSVEDEPQTMFYPQVDGITPSVIEPQFDKDTNVRSKDEPQTDCAWKKGE